MFSRLFLLFIVITNYGSAKEKQVVKLVECDSVIFKEAKKEYDFYKYIDTSVASRNVKFTDGKVKLPLVSEGEFYEIEKVKNDFEELSYVGFIESIDCYLVHVVYPNSEQSLLIDRTTGLMIQSLPYVVPCNGKYLIAYDRPTADVYYGIRVLKREGNTLKVYHSVKDKGWWPIDIVWKTDAECIIKAATDVGIEKYFKVIIK